MKSLFDITLSFGVQGAVKARLGVAAIEGKINIFRLQKEITQGDDILLNQELSIALGIPYLNGSVGFSRTGIGGFPENHQSETSFNDLFRNEDDDIVLSIGAAFGFGFEIDINITNLTRPLVDFKNDIEHRFGVEE